MKGSGFMVVSVEGREYEVAGISDRGNVARARTHTHTHTH